MAQSESNHIPEMMTDFTDARTIKWPLVSSPMLMIFISVIYLFIVYFAGPLFMKNRKPYSLKRFMQFYNLFQIIANFLIVFNVMTNGRPFAALWIYCESFDKLCGSKTEKQLKIIWWTLLLKIIDLSETIVFVLRKKDSQVTFLHTYHHVTTVIYSWLVLRYFIHGYAMTIITLNCSVHVIMYSYYFLSTFKNIQPTLLPYKKWITFIQMVQILFLTVASLQGFSPNCGNKIVKYFSIITFLNGIVILSFFFNFYASYKKSKVA